MFSNEIRLEPQTGLIYSAISSIYFGTHIEQEVKVWLVNMVSPLLVGVVTTSPGCREIFARHSMLKTAENTVK